jgi:hypothetical protein
MELCTICNSIIFIDTCLCHIFVWVNPYVRMCTYSVGVYSVCIYSSSEQTKDLAHKKCGQDSMSL